MTHEIRVLDPTELRAEHSLFAATIHHGPADDVRWSRTAGSYSPGRTFGAHEAGQPSGPRRRSPPAPPCPAGPA